LLQGWSNGLETFKILMKIMIPVYVVITLIQYSPVLPFLGEIFRPFMSLFGLPGEAVTVLIFGKTINIYAAVGAISGLDLSIREITILGGMLTISHSLLMETAIIKQANVPVKSLLLIRVGASFVAGIILNWIL